MKWLIPYMLALPAFADPVDIIDVSVLVSDGSANLSVTVEHPDTGWDHYADGWRVELADGTILGVRELLHPHVNEQPFTRSLSGVVIPAGIATVFIRARCSIDGWGNTVFEVALDP